MNAPTKIAQLGPEWVHQRVTAFDGQRDTNKHTGADYDTTTLAEIWKMLPGSAEKSEGRAIIPSTYNGDDAREHARQRADGQFIALTGDIDSGNHPLAKIKDIVAGLCKEAAHLIYSSPHARPGDARWRIIIPIDKPLDFDKWRKAQYAFYAYLAMHDIRADYALARAAQPVYLPNVPHAHPKTGEQLRDESGEPLFYERHATDLTAPALAIRSGVIATYIREIVKQETADERERQRLVKEAAERRANRPTSHDGNIINDFNRSNSITDLLTLYGYQPDPGSSIDWRSPLQTGESYATRVFGDTWVSLSASDAGHGIGQRHPAGCYGDAYDLFVHYEHGGDHKAAWRKLCEERRVSAFTPPPMPDPQDPGPMPDDYALPDYEDVDDETLAIMAGVDLDGSQSGQPKKGPLPLEWAGDAEPVIDGFWLIDDWLPTNGIAAIYGHPGCGKSFFALHMAAHIASGKDWAGRRVEQGLVVYVVAEGSTGFRNRMFAMRQSGEIAADAPLAFIPSPIDMQAQDGDVLALISTIEAAAAHKGMKPAMIVLDTLSKTFGAGKENTDDMVAYINNCQRVASAFECLTCVIHHRPKDQESRDLRGHSSLRGNVDTTILVEAGDIKVATTLKQKDGEDNVQVRFKLNRVVIGIDRHGIERSTCLVEVTDEMPSDADELKLSPAEIEAMQALERTIAIRPKEWNFGGTFEILPCCYQSHWRDQLEQDGTIGWDNSEAGRKRWQRTRKSLIKKGLTIERDGHTAIIGTRGT